MKKIFIISFLLLFLTSCGNEDIKLSGKDLIRKKWIEEKIEENNLYLYSELENGNKIYSFLKQIKYTENGKEKELKKELKSKKTTMEEFIKKMDVYSASNDGGSVYFETNDTFFNQKFYLAWCNSLEANGGIHDVFIVKDREKVFDFCVIEDDAYYE